MFSLSQRWAMALFSIVIGVATTISSRSVHCRNLLIRCQSMGRPHKSRITFPGSRPEPIRTSTETTTFNELHPYQLGSPTSFEHLPCDQFITLYILCCLTIDNLFYILWTDSGPRPFPRDIVLRNILPGNYRPGSD